MGQNTIRLGIPKGSLEEATLALFDQAGLEFTGASRSLWLGSNDPEIAPVLLRPQEIPVYVESGRLDAGLAGHDWMVERDVAEKLVVLADLQYAKQTAKPVRWVLAVPNSSSIRSVDDLREECLRRDEAGEPRFTIDTELKRISDLWLAQRGIAATTQFSWGATEAKAGHFTDAIIEATETGSSLRANGLRIIAEVFHSTTQFFGNKRALRDPWKRSKLEGLAHLLAGALRADEMVQLTVIEDEPGRPLALLLPADAQVTALADGHTSIVVLPKAAVPRVLPAVIESGATRAWVSQLSILYDNGQRSYTAAQAEQDAGANRLTVTRLRADRPLPERLLADVEQGFARRPMELPPKYFYDVEGSNIFEKITELPEYYVTRAETEALVRFAGEIVEDGGWQRLVELGSGSSKKTRTLLEAMIARSPGPVTYVPFDISESALREAADALLADYPSVRVDGFCGDFLTEDLDAVLDAQANQLVAFLGSTIGNLTDDQRADLFSAFARTLTSADAVLIGVDLVKDAAIIEPAYNDAAGVTEEFNKNVLRVLQSELGAEVSVGDFRHHAPYIEGRHRIEMRLYAERPVVIRFSACDLPDYQLDAGEYILTELSHKFTRSGLEAELRAAGLRLRRWWTDRNGWVGLALVTS